MEKSLVFLCIILFHFMNDLCKGTLPDHSYANISSRSYPNSTWFRVIKCCDYVQPWIVYPSA